MTTTSRIFLAAFLATTAVPAAALASSRVAQEANPRIMVPSPSPEGAIAGCWFADRQLYGYRLKFCVHDGGGASYTVTGKGLYCHARLDWSQAWGGYGFTMDRTSCGRGMDWSADRFTCTLKSGWGSGPSGRMPIPSQGARLDCMYWPVVWGYTPTAFSAHRG